MLNITICDDEKAEVEYLSTLVTEWAQTGSIGIAVISFNSAEEFLFSYETEKALDILLLDIQMKQLDGIALAKQLRASGGQMQIIFITGFPDFIAEGYEVSALHYLIKPIKKEKLFELLDKALDFSRKTDDSIIIDTSDGKVRVYQKDILYTEAFAHKTTIQTINGSIDARLYISTLEEMLGDGFCFTHRSYLVGIKHIKQITKTEITMDNGKRIPLSRRRYEAVNRAFINYHKGVV